MQFLRKFFTKNSTSLNTQLERNKLARTMPGETGALAATRLGHGM